eukprot:2749938-Prymnesium_polylepis.1
MAPRPRARAPRARRRALQPDDARPAAGGRDPMGGLPRLRSNPIPVPPAWRDRRDGDGQPPLTLEEMVRPYVACRHPCPMRRYDGVAMLFFAPAVAHPERVPQHPRDRRDVHRRARRRPVDLHGPRARRVRAWVARRSGDDDRRSRARPPV